RRANGSILRIFLPCCFYCRALRSFPTRRSSDLSKKAAALREFNDAARDLEIATALIQILPQMMSAAASPLSQVQEIRLVDLGGRSEEHTSELQSREKLVCRLLLEKKKRRN